MIEEKKEGGGVSECTSCFEFHGVGERSSGARGKFAVEFNVWPHAIPNMVRSGGEGRGQGMVDSGSGRSKEAGTSLKCQRHHNSRGAKERLLAVAEPAKKGSQSLDEQIKVPSMAPCTRLSRVEGAIGDPVGPPWLLTGTKDAARFARFSK